MEINEILAVALFVSFILLIFTGIPIAWVLGGLSILFTALALLADRYLDAFIGIDWAYTSIVVDRIWELMTNWVLVALPMFIFMGLMLERSGLAEQLMTNFIKVLGRLRGGAAVTVALVGILLAASTGIIGASVVLLAMLGLPIMMRSGYQHELAVGTVCSVGTLGILIPPSIMLVLMADRLAISVGDLFLGAVFPGLLLGAAYIGYIILVSYVRPDIAPVPKDAERLDLKTFWHVLVAVLPPAGLILVVLGSIFAGIATPTEASGIGACGATLLAWANRKLSWAIVRDVCRQTSKTTAFIFAIFLGATAFSLVLRGLGGDELIERALNALPFGPAGTIAAILFVTFLLGFFLDWIEISLIVLPLIAPVVVGLGYDIVWFTVLFAVCLQTSFLTPPVGFALFFIKGVAPPEISIGEIYRGVAPFVLIQLIGLMIVFIWQDIVTWLPGMAYGR